MKTVRSFLVILTSVACIALTGSQSFAAAANEDSASASDNTSVSAGIGDEKITFDGYKALVDDLKRSDVPRTKKVVDGTTVYTFSIEGSELELADVGSEDSFEAYLGGGIDGGGAYVTFNQVDQGALISGAAAGFAAAICAIPAVGTAACVVAVAIVAAASYYAINYGRCPNGGDLKVYVHNQVASCVPAG